MIFLLNPERVYREVFELFTARTATLLGVSREAVNCTVDLSGDRLVPSLQIAGLPDDKHGPVTTELIQRLWQSILPQFGLRLRGLHDCRHAQ